MTIDQSENGTLIMQLVAVKMLLFSWQRKLKVIEQTAYNSAYLTTVVYLHSQPATSNLQR